MSDIEQERIIVLTAALREIEAWVMHSGTLAYKKGEYDPCGYYNAAYYLMEAEIAKAREIARSAIKRVAA